MTIPPSHTQEMGFLIVLPSTVRTGHNLFHLCCSISFISQNYHVVLHQEDLTVAYF
jgi:hypothetical protein